MLADFPPHIQREIQRILDAEAMRLLLEARERAREAGEPLPMSLILRIAPPDTKSNEEGAK